ncbi:MAG: hypothetical protein PHS93_07965 [Candidatus Omnitrophica bacterium]|nr:hypothetical protein [Methanocellales archaeon]MDD5353078.1 hypothetical protein [Candidatus Omnitrophota bacterium]
MFSKKKPVVIPREVAEESFDQFCDDWEIDTDSDGMNQDDKDGFRAEKAKIVNAIMKGRLIYNSNNTFSYTVSNKSEKTKGQVITLKRPNGRTLRQADRAKEGKNVEKSYNVLASMMGDDISLIDGLDMIDLKPLLSISSLFLAS